MKMTALASDKLIQFQIFSETGIYRNSTGSKNLMSSTKFAFFAQIGKARLFNRSLIGQNIFYFSSETALCLNLLQDPPMDPLKGKNR